MGADPWIARIGLLGLSLVAILGTLGMTWIAIYRLEIPPALAFLVGGAGGNLGTVVVAMVRVTNGKNPPSATL